MKNDENDLFINSVNDTGFQMKYFVDLKSMGFLSCFFCVYRSLYLDLRTDDFLSVKKIDYNKPSC